MDTPHNNMIKVLLVDDHELVRSGIEALLNVIEDITVVGVCDCGEQALQVISNELPDVILMDINMPGMGGIEACRRIKQMFPNTKLIVLSIHVNGSISQQISKLGVEGFVYKGSPVIEMVAAIRAVMLGNRYMGPIGRADGHDISPFSSLSQRESEVVQMILQGQSISEISEFLQLNAKTVNTYRYRIYGKLKIKNDVELTLLALKFDFIENS